VNDITPVQTMLVSTTPILLLIRMRATVQVKVKNHLRAYSRDEKITQILTLPSLHQVCGLGPRDRVHRKRSVRPTLTAAYYPRLAA
jgi:hypothetical protein